MCVCVYACVRGFVRACVCACVRACVRACVSACGVTALTRTVTTADSEFKAVSKIECY